MTYDTTTLHYLSFYFPGACVCNHAIAFPTRIHRHYPSPPAHKRYCIRRSSHDASSPTRHTYRRLGSAAHHLQHVSPLRHCTALPVATPLYLPHPRIIHVRGMSAEFRCYWLRQRGDEIGYLIVGTFPASISSSHLSQADASPRFAICR